MPPYLVTEPEALMMDLTPSLAYACSASLRLEFPVLCVNVSSVVGAAHELYRIISATVVIFGMPVKPGPILSIVKPGLGLQLGSQRRNRK